MITITLQELVPTSTPLTEEQQTIVAQRNEEARNSSHLLEKLLAERECTNHKHKDVLNEVRVVARMEYVKVDSIVCCHKLDEELKSYFKQFSV